MFPAEDKKDLLTHAIANNPCSKCRIAQKTECTCGLGAGDGGGNSNDELQFLNSNNKKSQFDDVKHLLSIDHSQTGKLVFQSKTVLTEEEVKLLQEFLKAVKVQFEKFKADLATQGVSVKDFVAELSEDGNKLTITIPGANYYKAFVNQLTNSGLLPESIAEQLKKETLSVQANTNFFSPKLVPSNSKEKGSEELAQQASSVRSTPNPFHTELKPINKEG